MKYRLLEHVSLTEVDDEAVLLNLNTGAYYGLNHVGALLLKFLQTEVSIEIAVQQVSERYQANPNTVKKDAEQLIIQLLEHELVAEHLDSE